MNQSVLEKSRLPEAPNDDWVADDVAQCGTSAARNIEALYKQTGENVESLHHSLERAKRTERTTRPRFEGTALMIDRIADRHEKDGFRHVVSEA